MEANGKNHDDGNDLGWQTATVKKNDPWVPQNSTSTVIPTITSAPADPLRTIISSESYVKSLVLGQELLEELVQRQLGGGSGGSGMGRAIAHTVRHSIVNSALNRAVRFVIGETATPSPEMINYGMSMRREPRTRAERDVYLWLMKRAARATPDALLKYASVGMTENGTMTFSVDYYALDADITRRALLYQLIRSSHRRDRERQRQQELQHQAEIDQLQARHEQNLRDALGITVSPAYTFDNFGGPTTAAMDIGIIPLEMQRNDISLSTPSLQPQPTTTAAPAASRPKSAAAKPNGYITLLDILTGNERKTAAEPPITTPTNTAR